MLRACCWPLENAGADGCEVGVGAGWRDCVAGIVGGADCGRSRRNLGQFVRLFAPGHPSSSQIRHVRFFRGRFAPCGGGSIDVRVCRGTARLPTNAGAGTYAARAGAVESVFISSGSESDSALLDDEK